MDKKMSAHMSRQARALRKEFNIMITQGEANGKEK